MVQTKVGAHFTLSAGIAGTDKGSAMVLVIFDIHNFKMLGTYLICFGQFGVTRHTFAGCAW